MKLTVITVCCWVLVGLSFTKASPYNKYGRTCKDILCIAGQEECIMETDACTSYTEKCGSYPTCKRKEGTVKRGCATVKCASGEFCSIRQENCSRPPCEIKPVCIAFRKPASSTQRSSVASSVLSRPSSQNSYRQNSYGNHGYSGNRNSWSWDRYSG